MTDLEVIPFINKQVELELVDGRVLRGTFVSFEAVVTGIGKYGVKFRTGPDPILHPERCEGIHGAEQIVSIAEK